LSQFDAFLGIPFEMTEPNNHVYMGNLDVRSQTGGILGVLKQRMDQLTVP
jgi:hypothetical protein